MPILRSRCTRALLIQRIERLATALLRDRHFRQLHRPGLDAVRLRSEQLFLVCSPRLVSRPDRIKAAADVLEFPLLHLRAIAR